MTVRPARGARFWSAVALACALLAAPRALLAQDDPTPFWTPDVPPPSKSAAPAGPKKEKKPKAPRPPKKERPPKRARPAPEPEPSDESSASEPEQEAPPAPTKKKHHYEPLPPLPHLEPELPPAQEQPARNTQSAYPQPYQPPYQPTYQPPVPSAPDRVNPPPEQAPQAAPSGAPGNYPSNYPAPTYQQPFSPPPSPPSRQTQTVVPIDEQRAGDSSSNDSSDGERFRRFSLELLGGAWGKATSDGGRDWQLAYGLDFGVGLFGWLQLDVRALRSGGTDGDVYVNATATHLLFDARLLGVVNFGKFALFAGGGGGMVLEQTQLFLQDVNGDPTTLSSSGIEAVGGFVGGVRVRPWRGLTLRAEFDGLIREGNFEPVILAGAGWAF